MSSTEKDSKDQISKLLAPVYSGNRKFRRFQTEKKTYKDAGSFISLSKYLALMPNQKLIPTIASAAGIDAVLISMSNAQSPHWLRLFEEVKTLNSNKQWLQPSKEGDVRFSVNLFLDIKTGSLRQTCWCGCGAPINGYQIDYSNKAGELDRVYCHWVFTDGKKVVLSIPLAFILKDFPQVTNKFQTYCHRISCNDKKMFGYYGITGRNWAVRLNEHILGIRQGDISKKKFYSKFFKEIGGSKKFAICFELIDIDLTFEQAMDWEEHAVDGLLQNEEAIILNMIPGGFKGLRMLHKLGITSKQTLSEYERDIALEKFASLNPAFTRWADDNFYIETIFKRRNTLNSPEQVQEIRWFFENGLSRKEINEYTKIGYDRVCRILSGKSYSRA